MKKMFLLFLGFFLTFSSIAQEKKDNVNLQNLIQILIKDCTGNIELVQQATDLESMYKDYLFRKKQYKEEQHLWPNNIKQRREVAMQKLLEEIQSEYQELRNTIDEKETNVKLVNSVDLNRIINLIKEGFQDSNYSKLYTKTAGEKTYVYNKEENVAFQGRPCWKTEYEIVLFTNNGVGSIVKGLNIDLITPGGGHGQTLYKIDVDKKEIRYIFVDNIIYKWTEDDCSDLDMYLIYDSKNDQLKSIDRSKTYNPSISNK